MLYGFLGPKSQVLSELVVSVIAFIAVALWLSWAKISGTSTSELVVSVIAFIAVALWLSWAKISGTSTSELVYPQAHLHLSWFILRHIYV